MPSRRSFLTTAAALPFLARSQSQAQQESSAKLPPAIAALPNRIHEATPIPLAERQSRADKARRLMLQQNIAAIVITGGTSLTYFTGARAGQSERLFAWILPATGAPTSSAPPSKKRA
jgi:Xaa-Pro dipeptidase